MKVNIGPYRDWIGPYQIADLVFFWVDRYVTPEDRWDSRLRDRFGGWLSETWVNKFCNWIHEKKKRKVKVTIDYYDTWAMDHTLAFIILPMLKDLKESKYGSPFVDDKDVPKHLRSTNAPPKKNDWDTDDFHHDRWDYVLDEMIWAFEQIVEDKDFYFDPETGGFDSKAYHKHQKRIDNGLALFGKYYRGLWS